MANRGDLEYRIALTLDEKGFVKGIRVGGAEAKQFGAGTQQAHRGVQSLSGGLRDLKILLASLGLTVVAVEAVRMATAFDTAFLRINTLVGISRQQTDLWRDDIKSLAAETGRGPLELAQALYNVTSAGFATGGALEVVRESALAAAVGLGETGDIAKATAAAVQAYGAENLSAADAVGVLIGTIKEGAAEASELAPVIGRVVGLAAEMGVEFEEVGAFIAIFTRLGINAAEATTALRAVFSSLLGPTKLQQEALGKLNLDLAGFREQIAEKGLAASLVDLVSNYKGNADALAAIIPQVHALAGVLGTAGSQGDEFVRVSKDIAAAMGTITAETFELAQASPEFAFQQLKAEIDNAKLALGEGLLPALVELSRLLKDQEFQDAARNIGEVLGKVLLFAAKHFDLLVVATQTWLALKLSSVALKIATSIQAMGAAAVTATGAINGLAIAGGALTALIPILLLINSKVVQWGKDSSRAMDEMVRSGQRAKEAVSGIEGELRQIPETARKIAEVRRELDQTDWSKLDPKDAEAKQRSLRVELENLEEVLIRLRDLGSVKVSIFEGVVNESQRLRFAVDDTQGKVDELNRKLSDPTALDYQSGAVQKWRSELTTSEESLSNLRSELSTVDAALARASAAGLDWSETLKEVKTETEGTGGATGGLSEKLQEAVDKLTGTTAANQALLLALEDSQLAYDTLNVLLEAGIPLHVALTGAYDDEAKAMLQSARDLEALIELRKEEAEILARIEELKREIDLRETSSIDTSAPIATPDLEPAKVDWSEYVDEIDQQWRQTVGKMSTELKAVMKQAWQNVQNIAANTIAEILKTGKVSWKSLWGSMIDILAQMLAKMLITWLANLATRVGAELAAAATVAAAWATVGSGVGGNTGGASGLGSLAKGANYLWKSGGGAALGALLIVGAVAGFAYWAHSQAAKKAAERWFSIATVREGWSAIFGSAEVVQFASAIRDKIAELFAAIGASLSSLPEITVEAQASGDAFRAYIDGVLIGYFETFEQAFQTAALKALSQSDLSSVIPEIVDAINRGAIQSFEQLSQVADVFIRIKQVTDPTTAQINQFNAEIAAMRQVLVDAGIAATALADYTAAGWQAIRDSITGVTKSEEELQLERMEAFNAARDAEEARLQTILASAEAQAAAAAAEIARLEIVIAGIEAQTDLNDKALQFLATLYESLGLAQAALASATASAAEARALLESLPEPITPEELQRPKTGGGGGFAGPSQAEQDAQRVADAIVQIARSLMVPLAAALAELDAKYEDLTQAAHGDADALARLIELREQERQIMIDQAVNSFYGKLRDFENVGGSALGAALGNINQGAAALRKEGRELGKALEWTGERIRKVMDRINDAAQRQRELLLETTAQDLLLSALDFLGRTEEAERIRWELQKAQLIIAYEELKIAAAKYEIEIAILEELGGLVAEIQGMEFPGIAAPGGGGSGGGDGGLEEWVRQVKEALNKMKEIQARQLSPFEQSIRGVVDEFAELRRVLGWTTELQALYAQELQRVIAEQLSAISRMQDDMRFSEKSPYKTEDKFRMAQTDLNEAMAALRAGDLSQVDKIPELAQRILDLNPGGKATEGYRFIFESVNRALDEAKRLAEEAAMGIEPGGANDPFAWLRSTPTAGDDAIVAAVNRVTARTDFQTDEIRAEAEREAEREERRREREEKREKRLHDQEEFRSKQLVNRVGISLDLLRDIRKELRDANERGGKITKAGIK